MRLSSPEDHKPIPIPKRNKPREFFIAGLAKSKLCVISFEPLGVAAPVSDTSIPGHSASTLPKELRSRP